MNKYDRSDRVFARIDHQHDHTRSQLRGRLLNIKSRLFARKMAAGPRAWLSRCLIKCKRGSGHSRSSRQIKLFRRIYADRAQKSGSREENDVKATRKKKEDRDEQERIMCRKGTCLFRACYLPIERSQEKQLDSS